MGQLDHLTARGWLTLPEREFLRDAAAQVRTCFPDTKRTFVNIGVEYGASLHCLRAGDQDAQLIGIDLDCTKLEGDPSVELWTGDSAALGRRTRRAVHLLFVDGGYNHPVVDDDLRLWGRRVAPGGLLLLHDYSDSPLHRDVVAAVDAWWRERLEDWRLVPGADTIRAFRREGA